MLLIYSDFLPIYISSNNIASRIKTINVQCSILHRKREVFDCGNLALFPSEHPTPNPAFRSRRRFWWPRKPSTKNRSTIRRNCPMMEITICACHAQHRVCIFFSFISFAFLLMYFFLYLISSRETA